MGPTAGYVLAVLAAGVGADTPPLALYAEAYRPQFHFTYQRGWMSDINGLVFYRGEYHLFSQHCPGSSGLDNSSVHWGHAVSRDLVHWQELPPALAPDPRDGPPFSGSVVVDRANASGLQTGHERVLVAFYTGARYILSDARDGVVCVAYSNDRGRTWTTYTGNPVVEAITHYNRDPKVFWHEPSRQWIMVLSLSCANHWLDGDYRFALLASRDLKRWRELSRFEMPTGLDCPDMFELPVNGDPRNRRWVVWAGDGTHAIGAFDGVAFVPTEGIRRPLLTWEENGANGYAAQTFSDIPEADGRRIQIAWLRHGDYPGMPFSQQALFPCELTLRTVNGRIELFREPVREISTLHGRHWRWRHRTIRPGQDRLSVVSGELFELRAEIDPGRASGVTLRVRSAALSYDPARGTLTCLGKSIPAASADGRLRLQLLIDRTSLEVFADGGRTSLSFFLPPSAEGRPLGLSVAGGNATARSIDVWELRPIWSRGTG